jgi:hypothetical protein
MGKKPCPKPPHLCFGVFGMGIFWGLSGFSLRPEGIL